MAHLCFHYNLQYNTHTVGILYYIIVCMAILVLDINKFLLLKNKQ